MFAPHVYRERRDALCRRLSEGMLLLPGLAASPINFAANHYPFRQDSSFLYYVGLDRPEDLLVVDIDIGEEILYGPEDTPDDVIWSGPRPSLPDRAACAGIARTGRREHAADRIRAAREAGRPVHYLPAYRADQVLLLSRLLAAAAERIPAGVSRDFIRAVVSQRSVKTAEEVAEIESALGVCCTLFQALLTHLPHETSAIALAGFLEGRVGAAGRRMAFPPIVTHRGEILHGRPDGTALNPGDLLLMDIGTESREHYASDITRTLPVSGRFTPRQKDVYEIVLAAQKAAIARAAPGVKFVDLHRLAAGVICEGMRDLGLMKGPVEDAVAAGAHALFFPHGLGHMLGLDAHDMEALGEDNVGYDEETRRSEQFGLAALRLGRRLEAGFVVTVEPGVYFIPDLIDRWRSQAPWSSFIDFDKLAPYRRFGGIRIEDVILITPGGARALGPVIPKSAATVEAAWAV